MAPTQENHECQENGSLVSLREEKNEEWIRPGAFPAHVRVNESVGGVCMWARTDSPATPHCPAITTQLTSKVFNLAVD